MKPWHWALIGAIATALLFLFVKGKPGEREQRLSDSLAVEQHRSRQLAALDSIRQRQIDSLLGLIAAEPIDSLSELRAQAARDRDAARAASEAAIAAIAQARDAADSLLAYERALAATIDRAEAADALAGRLGQELEATGRMLALMRQAQQETAAQRDSARAEAGRWKLLAIEGQDIIEGRRGFGPRLGRAAETGAVVAVTIDACSEGRLLSIGCLAGAAVSGSRLLSLGS